MLLTIERAGLVFAVDVAEAGGPSLRYWGKAGGFDPAAIPDVKPRASGPDVPELSPLFPLEGRGFFGEPALLAAGDTGCIFDLEFVSQETGPAEMNLVFADKRRGIEISLDYALTEAGLLRTSARLLNNGDTPLALTRLNALSLPLPGWADTVDLGYGRWSSEGHNIRVPLVAGKIERTNRAGRPGFEGGPHILVTAADTSEQQGPALGVALAHSGNFTVAAERFGYGEGQLIAAEWVHPGEIGLAPGESYETPPALAALSDRGLNGISEAFHAHARSITPVGRTHRPVQLNSWEAVYFDVNEATALRLIDSAAAIGAERFVLDDGWFKGRPNDRSGLGDWVPDEARFPNGLKPLAEHAKAHGMEFGLWFEPEMVNENSDLYRAHPDWILTTDGKRGPTGRHQLVLDLSNPAVTDYLFERIDTLLRSCDIRYIKWDCNRDFYPAATPAGPATYRQIKALYALFERLRAAHPNVSIESCASGGGRMDLGVLEYADRFWPSDATDPFERIRIQRRASLFFPVETLGAHVGSSPNHITGRRSSMRFRCLVAMFGHFGIELDPETLPADDRAVLQNAIATYKVHRDLIIDGKLVRQDVLDAGVDAQLMVSPDGSRALFRALRMEEPGVLPEARIGIAGLPEGRSWRVREINLSDDGPGLDAGTYTSEQLAQRGLDAMPLHAGHGRLFLLEAVA